MRDAFGGSFMLYLLIIFIFVFITFMAETLKYVQAYKVKNAIINYIEEYEGFDDDVISKLEDDSTGYIARSSYRPKNLNLPESEIEDDKYKKYCSNDYGYCVERKYYDGERAYYKVTTYIALNFPIFNIFDLDIEVSGMTRFVNLG